MTDLRTRVQQSLAGSYTLERELGGGGMSRVFVADEQRLGRKVVVKVLAPELAAAVSAERFEREIRLAASLQQANIVPVLTAGDVDGLPYYTMPWVEGESLRVRLGRGPVAIAEAVAILRDVARALAYAHERGVVHRDIKPDNILLSGGTAVVTDFGIAKAIAAAQQAAPGATLTQLGTAVGTPAYMAPEQAAGDPATDHRADVYAFGVTAYELLAGEPPFHGLSPHKLLAAHMAEAPRPLGELRPDCPPALERLVMQCLAKDPADRPDSADAVLAQLEAAVSMPGDAAPAILLGGRGMLGKALGLYAGAFLLVALLARLMVQELALPDWVFPGALIVMALGLPVILFTGYAQVVARRLATATPTLTPQGSVLPAQPRGTIAGLAVKAGPHLSWHRAARAGMVALVAFVVLVATFMALRALGIGPAGSLLAAGKITAHDRVLVAGFDAPAADSSLGATIAEAVRTNLAQSRAVQVVPTSAIVAALQRMQRPASTLVDLATGREIAVREGIKAVVGGSIASAGSGFIITARLVSAESGDELASYRESARDAGEIIPAVDRLTRKLRGRIGESLRTVRDAPGLEQVTTGSLGALRSYTAALRANDVEGDYPRAVELFREAIRQDSTFAAAYVQLSYSLASARSPQAPRDSALRAAFRLRDRLPDRERYAIEGAYYSRGASRDRRRAIAAFERAIELDSSNADAMNSLAIQYTSVRDYAKAETLYRRALAVDPTNRTIQSNLFSTLVYAGRFAAADSVERMLRSTGAMFAGVALRAVHLRFARRQYDSAEAMARATAASPNPGVSLNGTEVLGTILLARGKLAESERVNAQLRAAQGGRPADSLDLAVGSAFREGWQRDRPARGLEQLDAALRRYPLSQRPANDWLALGVARIYSFFGAPAKARAVMAQYDARAHDSLTLERQRGERETLEAAMLLAEGKHEEAIARLRRTDLEDDGLPSACALCMPAILGMFYDRAGQPDSAMRYLELYANSPANGHQFLDGDLLAPALKRLGELHENRGDRARAVEYYTRFLELWKDADPDLQPRVAEARARREALERGTR